MSSSVPGTLAGVTRPSRYHVPCIICKRRWQGDDGGSFDRCCDGCRDILIARDEASLAARSGHPVRLRPVGWPDPPPGMPAASALVSFRPLPGRGTVVAGDRVTYRNTYGQTMTGVCHGVVIPTGHVIVKRADWPSVEIIDLADRATYPFVCAAPSRAVRAKE